MKIENGLPTKRYRLVNWMVRKEKEACYTDETGGEEYAKIPPWAMAEACID